MASLDTINGFTTKIQKMVFLAKRDEGEAKATWTAGLAIDGIKELCGGAVYELKKSGAAGHVSSSATTAACAPVNK